MHLRNSGSHSNLDLIQKGFVLQKYQEYQMHYAVGHLIFETDDEPDHYVITHLQEHHCYHFICKHIR